MASPSLLERLRASPVLRELAYFTALGLGVSVLFRLFPSLGALLDAVLAAGSPSTGLGLPGPGGLAAAPVSTVAERALAAILVLVASLLYVGPIAWIYMVTKRQEGYQKTFVQVLLLLPVVVAAVVQVVRSDLALAFALTGIVAAIRFRTTFRDLKNAVFAFAAIAIGLTSGTGHWELAAVLSVGFTLLSYVLWRINVGGVEPALTLPAGPMHLSEALVPGESQPSVAVGSHSLIAKIDGAALRELAPHAEALAHWVRADALKSRRKFDTLLLVYAAEEKLARAALDTMLDEYASRWRWIESFDGPDRSRVLMYLLRLKTDGDVGELLARLQCAEECPMRAAELKSIRGWRNLLR